MAKEVGQNTDVEAPMKELAKKRKTFGYTSNKFGRVILTNQEVYDNMIRNNDTLRDRNGLNDNFANISEKEMKTIQKLAKSKVKAPLGTPKDEIKEVESKLVKDRAKLKKDADKIIIEKVSSLRNFMANFLADKIDDEKTNLSDSVLEALKGMEAPKTAQVDNTAELEEANAEIERLKQELAESKKAPADTPKTPAPKGDEDKGGDTGTPDAGSNGGDPFKDQK